MRIYAGLNVFCIISHIVAQSMRKKDKNLNKLRF